MARAACEDGPGGELKEGQVPVLRLSHSLDGDAHYVEIAVEIPGMARQTASSRAWFTVAPADMERIRWYVEEYPEGPADTVTRGIAAKAERLLAGLGEQL